MKMEIFDTTQMIQESKEILQTRYMERQIGVPTPTTPDRPNSINPKAICLWNDKRKFKFNK